MDKKFEESLSKQELAEFRRLYRVSGDGVAHLNVGEAIKSNNFVNAINQLLEADLVNKK